MHIEFRHLRTIKAIHDTGGLARAADQLHITQSALSHQIKGIEDQAGVELFVRRSKPLKLSAAGMKMLAAAEDILPRVSALEAEFSGLIAGSAGRLHIAIECHACFEWLFPVLEQFRKAWPEVDVDIRPGLAFDALPALRKEEVDLVINRCKPTKLLFGLSTEMIRRDLYERLGFSKPFFRLKENINLSTTLYQLLILDFMGRYRYY